MVFCMQSIKEHNMKANHNLTTTDPVNNASVCNLSKNTIWKQITTIIVDLTPTDFLYAIYQRTQYESKSQRLIPIDGNLIVCMQSIKEHNMKANHNFSTSKEGVTFCMQSIPAWLRHAGRKEHNMKANHNLVVHVIMEDSSVCNLSKNTPGSYREWK